MLTKLDMKRLFSHPEYVLNGVFGNISKEPLLSKGPCIGRKDRLIIGQNFPVLKLKMTSTMVTQTNKADTS